MARASGFNNEAVGRYFDLLENIIDEHKLTARRIYNMDESGISVVQKSCQKVIGLKGKHQIGSISSADRGVNTTVVCCNNAAGQYVPPLVIFKRKRMPTELSNGAPPGSVVTCNDSGWMDAEVSTKWLQHFVDFVKPTADKKVLLVLDGHTTHVKNLKAIELARKENVIMLCLPPHTTHKIQPLGRTLFKPLQTYYDQAAERWLRTHVGRVITPYQVYGLFNEAYCKAATMSTAINGFAKCGIRPCSFSNISNHSTSLTEALGENASTAAASEAETRTTRVSSTGAPTQQAAASTTRGSTISESIGSSTPPASTSTKALGTPSDTTFPGETRERTPMQVAQCTAPNQTAGVFFRSNVVALEPKLQLDRDNGSLTNPILMLQATCKADALRNNVIEHCLQHYDSLAELMAGDNLNADMPSHIRFTCLHDRLNTMNDPKSMIGEFEVSKTAGLKENDKNR